MCTDQEKELLPSPKFNVQAIIFPRSIINYASKQNLNDSFIGIAIPKTLEDLYTSAHQNILVFLNYHMLKSGLNNIEKPSSVAAIEKKILTNGTTLIGIIIQPGIVTYTYNKPLRVHGATFRIRYSKKDKKTFFEIEIPKDRLCGEEDCVTFVLESKETFLKTNTSLQECIIDESEIIFRLEITDNTNVNDLLESAVGKKWAVF
jgi:hypothetical protein